MIFAAALRSLHASCRRPLDMASSLSEGWCDHDNIGLNDFIAAYIKVWPGAVRPGRYFDSATPAVEGTSSSACADDRASTHDNRMK